MALTTAWITDFGWESLIIKGWVTQSPLLKGFGFNLWIVHLIWIAIVTALYPFCKKFSIYKQKNKFEAKKLGAALISRNIANHLKSYIREKNRDWHPLIYCWRGGQRSYAFATILDQIGWNVGVVDGGYKSFRRYVSEFLNRNIENYFLILLTGNTGTAKTKLLNFAKTIMRNVLETNKCNKIIYFR